MTTPGIQPAPSSPPHPHLTKASPAARRALGACSLGWVFDGYETYALILVGAVAIRDLVAPDQLAQLPLYFGGLAAAGAQETSCRRTCIGLVGFVVLRLALKMKKGRPSSAPSVTSLVSLIDGNPLL